MVPPVRDGPPPPSAAAAASSATASEPASKRQRQDQPSSSGGNTVKSLTSALLISATPTVTLRISNLQRPWKEAALQAELKKHAALATPPEKPASAAAAAAADGGAPASTPAAASPPAAGAVTSHSDSLRTTFYQDFASCEDAAAAHKALSGSFVWPPVHGKQLKAEFWMLTASQTAEAEAAAKKAKAEGQAPPPIVVPGLPAAVDSSSGSNNVRAVDIKSPPPSAPVSSAPGSGGPQSTASDSPAVTGPPPGAGYTCKKCGKRGLHLVQYCPLVLEEERAKKALADAVGTGPKGHNPPGPTYVCNRCGKKGHWIQDCALLEAQARQAAAAAQQPQESEQQQLQADAEPEPQSVPAENGDDGGMVPPFAVARAAAPERRTPWMQDLIERKGLQEACE